MQDYALLRAADLALADGYDWFRVSDRFDAGRPAARGSSASASASAAASFGRHSAVGVRRRRRRASTWAAARRSVATLEVLMGKGPKPPEARRL